MTARRILVTSALPYANGHIHLGHLVEYLQTDIWVRFQKLRGNRCIYLCADDTHGTAITIRAKQEGRSEEALIADMRAAHVQDFTGFGIEFDNYGSTHCPENRELCGQIWAELRKAGIIAERDVVQLYDPKAGTFLADRFVKGNCPKCDSPDQYGDSCEKCGSTYSPTDLKNPRSAISGAVPELRSAKHLFIETEKYHDFLAQWTKSGTLHDDVANWLASAFLAEPLRDWDVSRPAPYFGFEISDSPGNYWYVWFDAPIGYIASTYEWAKRSGEKLDDWWKNPNVEIHHFIGKDITYFHTLFWPVMLKASGFSLPTKVHIHGFLTVNGEKMSKARGTFILASKYLKHLDPSALRYFYASKLTPKLDNIDLNLDEYTAKVNGDLVGKIVNLASRTARFVEQTGLSAKYPDDGGLFAAAAAAGTEIADGYETCDYNRAVRTIMELADRANKFVADAEPWKKAKDPTQAAAVQDICTVALNVFRQLVTYLAPVLPKLAADAGKLFAGSSADGPIAAWSQTQQPLIGAKIAKFENLMNRIDPKQVQAMVDDSREANEKVPSAEAVQAAAAATATDAAAGPAGAAPGAWNDGSESLAAEPMTPICTIDDFVKIDLRVARVIAAEHVPDAKKLLKLTLSLGGEEKRNVFAGIKSAYKPEELVGRLVICVANLQPRQMKFGLSEGMVTAAGGGGPEGKEIFLLSPDSGAKPGQRVH